MFAQGFNFSYFDRKKSKFASIELDLIISQDITLANIVSEHTLESGELFNDAIHNLPLKISMSAIISDMAQSTLDQFKDKINPLDTFLGIKNLKNSKSLRAWRELYLVWKSKTLVSVSSTLQSELFENMAIKEIVVSPDGSESLTFSVNLQQVLLSQNIKALNLSPEIGKQSERK